MKTIEMNAKVTEERKITIYVPENLPTGDYEIVVVFNSLAPKTQPSIQVAQSLLRKFIPEGRELSVELIQQRREESQNE